MDTHMNLDAMTMAKANKAGTRRRLGDLVKVVHGWPFKSSLFSEELKGGPIVVSIGNFNYTGGFRFDATTVKEYVGDYPKEYELKPDDILLVMTCQTAGGEILGIPGRIPSDGRTYLHNQRMGKVVFKDMNTLHPDYFYYLALSREFNQALCGSATGSKILHTSPGRIEAFEFDLPSMPEQRTAADLLRALDDKIELNRRMNGTLEAMAQALFKEWFVARNAPGGAKEEWDTMMLDEVAYYRNGLALQRFRPKEGEKPLPVVKIAQMRSGLPDWGEWASPGIDPECILYDGDVVFSWSGSLMAILWCGGKAALNQHLFKVTSTKFPKWFYYLWTQEYMSEFQDIASNKATTMGHINRDHLKVPVPIPPVELLKRGDEAIAPLLDRIVANKLESRTLSALRDTLLPKLMRGEVKVKQHHMQ